MTTSKRVSITQALHNKLMKIDPEGNKAIKKLLKDQTLPQVSLLVLEDIWWDFSDNPGHASVNPLMESLSRLHTSLQNYHLNFFDANGLESALNHGLTVPNGRILLHIGSHGTKNMIGRVQVKTAMEKVAKLAPSKGKRLEGLILSSCQVGNNVEALQSALKGQLHWVIAYKANVDWLGSSIIDASLINAVCSESDSSYCESVESICKILAKGLERFNPNWKIDDGDNNNARAKTLKDTITLWVRPQKAKKPIDATSKLHELLAWE